MIGAMLTGCGYLLSTQYKGGINLRRFKYCFAIDHSSVSFAHPFNGEIGQYEIVMPEDEYETTILISDAKEFNEKLSNHIGLSITVELFALDIDEGLKLAQIRANYAIVILSFITNATINDPILIIGLETTESAKSTEFVQYFYMDGETLKQKRVVDGDMFEKFLRIMMKSDEKRIGRAIRWYRKGLNETDSIDRFMYFWLGLESMNKLLSKKFPEAAIIRTCKKCGYTQELKTINGIRSLFKNFGGDLEFGYKVCYELRKELQHGYGDIENAITIAPKCADSCREMLIKGLFIILEMGINAIEKHPNPVYNLIMPRLEFRGKYNIAPRDLTILPSLVVNDENIIFRIENGKCAVSFLNRVNANIPVSLELNGINFIAENGVSMVIDDIKLTPKSEV